MSCGSFCLGLRRKLTDLNPISFAFRQINRLDSAPRIEMFDPF